MSILDTSVSGMMANTNWLSTIAQKGATVGKVAELASAHLAWACANGR